MRVRFAHSSHVAQIGVKIERIGIPQPADIIKAAVKTAVRVRLVTCACACVGVPHRPCRTWTRYTRMCCPCSRRLRRSSSRRGETCAPSHSPSPASRDTPYVSLSLSLRLSLALSHVVCGVGLLSLS
jgi:hypothetical protein